MPGEQRTTDDGDAWQRLPVALCRTSVDGRIVDVNRAFVACFRGRDRASVMQWDARQLYVIPGDLERSAPVTEAEIPRGVDTQMRRADGTVFWARETVRVERDVAGAPIFSERLIEDVTERRRAEGLLRASEVRYRRLFETAKDGILILDADTGDILDVNPFLCDLLGLTFAQVVGRKLWALGPFKDIAASQASFRELQRSEYIRYEDLPLETARGQRIAVEFVSNVYEAGGEKTIQCNVRDITERKRSADRDARLMYAVEQAGESIVMTDLRARIVYVNPVFERTSGWKSEEAVGRTARILRTGTPGDRVFRRMWEALTRGETWAGRFVSRRKDGVLVEHEATVSPVRDGGGAVVNYVAVSRDITRERTLERQTFLAQRMEAVARLAGGVAHEFNNLLGVIMGYAEIVHAKLSGTDPLKSKVARILSAAELAADLTRQLLAFGRKQVLQPGLVDINEIVSGAEATLRKALGERSELVTVLEPALGNVTADRYQIEQLLMKLVVNAREAMPSGGRVIIEARAVDLDTAYAAAHPPTQPGPYVLLAVADTGVGMDAATQARIFEPFFSTKEMGRGTGLGLSTVYGFVKQSDGYIWVESAAGTGTAFRIYLPRVDELPRLVPEEAAPSHAHGTVLLVEDEASLRALLRETLEEGGYSVLEARDGAEALTIAAAHAGPIQIMVTDVMMPGLSGPKLAELVARTRPDMKVLFISGYSGESAPGHGLSGPGRTFLSKPFSPDLLLHKLRESLSAG